MGKNPKKGKFVKIKKTTLTKMRSMIKKRGSGPPPRPPRPHPAAVASAIHSTSKTPWLDAARYAHNVIANKKYLSRGAKSIGLKKVGNFLETIGYGGRGGERVYVR